MTKEAVIRGAAKWIDRNVIPNLVPRGALRIAMKAATELAGLTPDLAMNLLAAKFPLLQTLVPLAGNDEAFASVVAAMKKAAEDEGGMVIQFCEVGLWQNTPHSLVVTPRLIDELYDDMKAAEGGVA